MMYHTRDGKVYQGPVVKLPDGRLMTGATFTPESIRVVEVAEEPAPVVEKKHDYPATRRSTKGKKKLTPRIQDGG